MQPPLRLGQDGPFFVGYAKAPDLLRRGLLVGGLVAASGGGIAGGILATSQASPGPGRWRQGAVQSWEGVLIQDPYPMLRIAGVARPALLCGPMKCGVEAEVASFVGQSVRVIGTPIERSGLLMIAATGLTGWITRAKAVDLPPLPTPLALGSVTLDGEVLDAKCWLGAMRPGEGLTHKGCAELCVRGGLPLMVVAGARNGPRKAFLALGAQGDRVGHDLLSFVGEPLRINAPVSMRAGWPTLTLDPSGLTRL